MSGLTRRTTCADVVKVLLEEQSLQSGALLSGPPQDYCLVEKWRGFERMLPNKTKLLRLWSAWGDEQEKVRFMLVKSDASLPNSGPRSAEARVVQSRESPGGGPGPQARGPVRSCSQQSASLSQEKQKRIVKKAFRKLDKMNKKKEQMLCKEKGSAERMETLVHLVISQDHTIRQQLQRIWELDREIEHYEGKVHQDRIQRHGVNYVQDTYLVEPEAQAVPEGQCRAGCCIAEVVAQLEEYAQRCEEVLWLQEELTEREALVESITDEIQEELNWRWMKCRPEEGGSVTVREVVCTMEDAQSAELEVEGLSECQLALEEERIRTQLDTSLYIGLRLRTDLDAVRGDLDLSLALWESKESELLDFLAKVESMEIEQMDRKQETDDGKGELGTGSTETEVESEEKRGGWVEQAWGLSKACNTNDEDSDTGLSSMHSQESDNPSMCESLV